jgi:hypothetical protein
MWVLAFVGAAVLLRDNVLDVVRQLAVLLSELAILTTIGCTAPDEVARGDTIASRCSISDYAGPSASTS